jgi:hypothetical protein
MPSTGRSHGWYRRSSSGMLVLIHQLRVEPMERKANTGTPWNQDGINTSISPAIQAQSARGPHQDTALRKEILLHL